MRYVSILLFFVLLGTPAFSSAQLATDISGLTGTLAVTLNPTYPAPGETVTATLDDYALGAAFSTITWYINGKEEPTLRNQRSISFVAGALGIKTTVTARLTLPGGSTLDASGSITPYYTDIIVEPQTYTPQMYSGRALPTVGSLVFATALITTDKGPLNPQTHSYLWKLNGTTIGGGSRNGAFQTSYTVPYGDNHTLSVEVYDTKGGLVARRGVNVRVGDVLPVLYEVNALYGLSHVALGTETPFIGNTLTLRAVPYNLDLRSNRTNTFTEWRVGSVRQLEEGSDPYEVTLERSGIGRSAASFKIRHREALLQGGEVSTILNF
jgi:hypothetical protein